MKRKEVYATTGTRLRVRVFGGFDFAEGDMERSDFAKYGYAKGVPMGGDRKKAPEGKAPALMIRALRERPDPIGGSERPPTVCADADLASLPAAEKVVYTAYALVRLYV
jgi:hypothetical protein